jgi:hypothetical protein
MWARLFGVFILLLLMLNQVSSSVRLLVAVNDSIAFPRSIFSHSEKRDWYPVSSFTATISCNSSITITFKT